MNKHEISVSLDPSMDGNLEAYLDELNQIDGISIHLDIMRKSMVGHDRCTLEQYRYVVEHSRHSVDVHVMAKETLPVIGNPRCFCTHTEEMIAMDKDKNVVIVMSVKPGQSGQSFDTSALERIKSARKNYPNARIIIDGGINIQNISDILDVCEGAPNKQPEYTFVVGSFIYNKPTQKDRAQAVAELSDIVRR